MSATPQTRRLPHGLSRSSPLRGCAVAVAAVAVVLGATRLLAALEPRMGQGALVAFVAAVVVSARHGVVPGLLATVLSALASAYVFLPPTSSVAIAASADGLALGVFVVVAAAVNWVVAARTGADAPPRPGDEAFEARVAERTRRLTALNRLTHAMAARQGSDEVFSAVAEAGTVVFGALWARVWVADPAARVLRTQASFGIEPKIEALMTDYPAIPYGQGVVGRIMESRASRYIRDVAADPHWLNRRLVDEGGVKSFAGLPLITGDRVVGVLAILFGELRDFTPEDRELMELLADHAALAIDTTRLVQAFSRASEEAAAAQQQFVQAQKMEAVGQLAGGVAHDFNNSLTVIIGRCELLLGRLPVGTPLVRDVELIRAAATRAARLTGQLLAFSRKQVLQPTVLDLNQLLGGIEEILRQLLPQSSALVLVLGARSPVTADPGQVEQAVMNLVINARDAMPEGGEIRLVTGDVDIDDSFVSADPEARPGAYVAVAVSDTGIGMDAATKARAFEPFFTTKAPGTGTGLGLSMVYGVVKQSGGYVAIESTPGRGTTVTVYLPRTRPSSGR